MPGEGVNVLDACALIASGNWKRPKDDAKTGISSNSRYPNLRSLHPKVWREIERAQPYRRPNKWLCQFTRLVNDNKHWDLVAQRVRRAAVGSPEAKDLGPVVFLHEAENEFVDYHFKGIDANAFLLLQQALVYIRGIVYEVQARLT